MNTIKFLLLIMFLIEIGICSYSNSKVRLEDMKYIIAKKDKYTQTQIYMPRPQLMCTGGNAVQDSHKVKSIICKNMGKSMIGSLINWQCESHLEKGYSIDNVLIKCEPYMEFFKSKQYVLYDSCAIHYELNYIDPDNSGDILGNLRLKNNIFLGKTTRSSRDLFNKQFKLDYISILILIVLVTSLFVLLYLSLNIFKKETIKNKHEKILPTTMPDMSTNLENSFIDSE